MGEPYDDGDDDDDAIAAADDEDGRVEELVVSLAVSLPSTVLDVGVVNEFVLVLLLLLLLLLLPVAAISRNCKYRSLPVPRGRIPNVQLCVGNVRFTSSMTHETVPSPPQISTRKFGHC